MDHRSDDLFVVDAEQAVKELAQYGAGTSELRLDRLVGSLAYFASVLLSIGLELEAAFASEFALAIPTMDEGDGRRTARDFAALVQEQLDAIRLRQAVCDHQDALDRLRLRFEHPQDLLRSASTPPADRQVMDQAARTIAAIDELAARLLVAAVPPNSDASNVLVGGTKAEVSSGTQLMFHEMQPDPDGEDTDDSLRNQDGVRSVAEPPEPCVPEVAPIESESLTGGVSERARMEASAPHITTNDPFGQTEPLTAENDVEYREPTVFPSDADVLVAVIPDERYITEAVEQSDSKAAPQSIRPVQSSVLEAVFGDRYEKRRIDALFSKALKAAVNGSWANGFSSLVEAIDELDQVAFADTVPNTYKVSGQATVRVQPQLAHCIVEELIQLGQVASLELSSVASTLLLSIHFEQAVRSDRMARIAARCAGRIEISANQLHLRLVLPASSRLLRVMPLKLDDCWVAASWAQYLDVVHESARGTEVKLLLGDVPDRILVKDLGLVSVGVRFELPPFLRRRDRFRGLVMLADGQLLPLLG